MPTRPLALLLVLSLAACEPSAPPEEPTRSSEPEELIDIDEGPDIAALQAQATAGDASAAERLGHALLRGEGATKDTEGAIRWLRAAAEAGRTSAMDELAALLEQKKDPEATRWWLALARDANHVEARRKVAAAANAGDVAMMHAMGEIELSMRDVKAACGWFDMAAAKGHLPSVNALAEVELRRATPDYEAAAARLRQAADAGDTPAMVSLAGLLQDGIGVERDPKGALDLLQRAVREGDEDARVALALTMTQGLGLPEPDHQAAIDLLDKAAAAGNAAAMRVLALAEFRTNGVTTKGRRLLQAAADKGDVVALEAMGDLVMVGFPTDDLSFELTRRLREDPMHLEKLKSVRKETGEWYTAAADKGAMSAQKKLGDMHALINQGSEANLTEAMIWYRRAEKGVEQLRSSGRYRPEHRRFEASLQCWMGFAEGNRNLTLPAKFDEIYRKRILKAAEMGNARAMAFLGQRYLRMLGGTPFDYQKGVSWYRKAIAAGDPLAAQELAALQEAIKKLIEQRRAQQGK